MITPNWHKAQGNAQNPHSLVANFQNQQVFSPGLGHGWIKTAESLSQHGLRLCIAEQLFNPVTWAKFGRLAQGK
jgi:hypothetical protein